MQLSEVVAHIESVAPAAAQASWDTSGVQVIGMRDEITHLALCLDPTPQSLTAAAELGADMVLSHHPLGLKPRLPAVRDMYHAALSILFRHDMTLYAAHTSLDANPSGPAGWLAEELGLTGLDFLEPAAVINNVTYGLGFCGDCSPRTLDEVTAVLKKHIDLDTATLCGQVPQCIRRIAYCTGSGASLIPEARAAGADLYITGDVKYHAALEAGICVLDVGHHSLEEEMMRRFAALLAPLPAPVRVSFIPSRSPFSRIGQPG